MGSTKQTPRISLKIEKQNFLGERSARCKVRVSETARTPGKSSLRQESFPQGSLAKRKKPTRVVGFILHCL